MAAKPKVAFYWCASCGGCEEAVVDLAEGILDIVGAVDIVFWPVALDFKVRDVEALPDGGIVASFINGAVRLSDKGPDGRLPRVLSKRPDEICELRRTIASGDRRTPDD